jgi:hypothetical protein
MPEKLSSDEVWKVIEKELFAVLGMVSAHDEARTVGIVYVVKNRKFYIGTETNTWKTRHVLQNPKVSMTIPIAKRIPLMPWIKIPAATVTFPGTARIIPAWEASEDILKTVFRKLIVDPDILSRTCIIEVTPEKEFVTYGIGIPLMQMRHPDKARGRAPVA